MKERGVRETERGGKASVKKRGAMEREGREDVSEGEMCDGERGERLTASWSGLVPSAEHNSRQPPTVETSSSPSLPLSAPHAGRTKHTHIHYIYIYIYIYRRIYYYITIYIYIEEASQCEWYMYITVNAEYTSTLYTLYMEIRVHSTLKRKVKYTCTLTVCACIYIYTCDCRLSLSSKSAALCCSSNRDLA